MTFETFQRRLSKHAETLPGDVRSKLERLYSMPNLMTFCRSYYANLGIMKPFFKESILRMTETLGRGASEEKRCDSGDRLGRLLTMLRAHAHSPNVDLRQWGMTAEEIISDENVSAFLVESLNRLDDSLVVNTINMAMAWTEGECLRNRS